MATGTLGNWREGQIVVVPHAWRGDGLLRDMPVEMQCHIEAGLRVMYADLLAQPVPDYLLTFIREFEVKQEGSRCGG